MKRSYVFTVAENVPRDQYEVLQRAIHGYFDWAYVHEIGIKDKASLSVLRRDERHLTLDDKASLRLFVAGAMAVFSRVQWNDLTEIAHE